MFCYRQMGGRFGYMCLIVFGDARREQSKIL